MTATEAVATLVTGPSVDLDHVLGMAGLQTRAERKYLLDAAEVRALGTDLARAGFRPLDIGGRRQFGYQSVYYDTPDHAVFQAHRQGRRRRFKARTRSYTDAGDCVFEVKIRGRRGVTVKERMDVGPENAERVHPVAQAFLDETLAAYGLRPVRDLGPVVRTRYRRCTLVHLQRGERVTFDVDLRFDGNGRTVHGPDRVVVESKSLDGGVVDEALARRGIREVGISKYSAAFVLTHPGVPGNRWNRLLRQEFGWRPVRSSS